MGKPFRESVKNKSNGYLFSIICIKQKKNDTWGIILEESRAMFQNRIKSPFSSCGCKPWMNPSFFFCLCILETFCKYEIGYALKRSSHLFFPFPFAGVQHSLPLPGLDYFNNCFVSTKF